MNVIDSHLHLFKAYSKDYPRPIHPGLADVEREVVAQELIAEMEKAGVAVANGVKKQRLVCFGVLGCA